MIEILSIRPCDGGDGIKLVCLCDGVKNTYTVSSQFYFESGIEKSCFSDEVYEKIVEEDSIYGAKRAAIRILASAQCSALKLYEKLKARGFSHSCAKNACDFVKEKGYIDEEWQIESYLKTLVIRKHVGRRKIIPLLVSKGYSGDAVCSVLDRNYSDSDFAKAKRDFLTEKFGKTKPDSYEEAAEMKKALYKQGF